MQKVKSFLSRLAQEVFRSATLVKALHTAWQAALAVVLVQGISKPALVAAIAAALSAAKTVLVAAVNVSRG